MFISMNKYRKSLKNEPLIQSVSGNSLPNVPKLPFEEIKITIEGLLSGLPNITQTKQNKNEHTESVSEHKEGCRK